MAVDPLETVSRIISFPESRMFQIKLIKISHKMSKSLMNRIIQKHPVLLTFFIPFSKLSDFISHKIQFLSGMCIHVHIKSPGLRKFFIIVTIHFLHDSSLSVNYLVMRKRKQETSIIIIHHGKSQFVIIVTSVFRGSTEIIQCIIHPAHVPFIIKT